MSLWKKIKTKRTKQEETLRAQDSPPTYSKLGPHQTEQIIATSTNAAFQEAWDLHWNELDESEKLAWSFQDVKTPLKVHGTIDDLNKCHRDQSITRKYAEGTLRFLRALETLMDGVTIGLQANPDVSSIIIGVVRVVMNVALKYFEYYEKLTEMMARLSDHLQVLNLFAHNSSKEPLLHSDTTAYFPPGLNSVTMLTKVQWAPFEEQFGRIQANLKHYTENLDRISAAMTLNSTLDIREDVSKVTINARTERTQFLQWLFEREVEDVHGIIRQKRLANTVEWLFEHKSFQRWMSEEQVKLLWIYGPAGTGKSVLASKVIDYLNANADGPKVLHLYFKGEDTTIQGSLAVVLSMILKQLCQHIEVLPETILKLYRKCQENARQPTYDDLNAMFTEGLKRLGRAFLVFDGLDEYNEKQRKYFLDFVKRVVAQPLAAKILITSRDEIDIRHALDQCGSLGIRIHDQTQSDVVKVVRRRVSNDLGHLDATFQEEIRQILTEKSGGLFLWIDFQLKELALVPEPVIKDQLNVLPSGLEDTYIAYFRKINAQPQTNRKLAQLCFLWCFHSTIRLEYWDIRTAVSMDLRVAESEEIVHSPKTLNQVTKDLLGFTGCFFRRFRPVHFSLKEFVMTSKNIPTDLREFLLPDIDSANEQLAIQCLEHLILGPHPLGNGGGILYYAGFAFSTHIQHMKSIPDAMFDLLDRIFIKEQHHLLKILAYRWTLSFENFPDICCIGSPSSMDPVFFMRCTGLDKVESIWTRYSNLEQPTTYPDGYLHLAVLGLLTDVVKEIIAQGADLDRLDAEGSTALHYACQAENPYPNVYELVKLLVEGGANYNLVNGEGQTPLQVAKEFRCSRTAEYLESVGAVG